MEKSKHILLIFNLLIVPIFTFAQKSTFLKQIIPDYINLQYGGSIGYLSGGVGYYFLNEKTTVSLQYGFVPKSEGGPINILTPKFAYRPFDIKITDRLRWQPINPTVFVSYTLGRNFDKEFDPNQYPEGYYWWSTALKAHLGFSTEIKILGDSKAAIKALSLYAETNTNDLYAVSWFENRTTTPITRIFFMGYGVRLKL